MTFLGLCAVHIYSCMVMGPSNGCARFIYAHLQVFIFATCLQTVHAAAQLQRSLQNRDRRRQADRQARYLEKEAEDGIDEGGLPKASFAQSAVKDQIRTLAAITSQRAEDIQPVFRCELCQAGVNTQCIPPSLDTTIPAFFFERMQACAADASETTGTMKICTRVANI